MEIVQYTNYREWDDVNYEFRLVQGNHLTKNGILKFSDFKRHEFDLKGRFIIFKLEI